MIKSMSIVCKIGTFPLGGGCISQISAVKAAGWLAGGGSSSSSTAAAAAASPGRPAHNNSLRSRRHSGKSPTRKQGETEWSPIVWMLKPTLVNTESPSTRLLESKGHLEMEKVEENVRTSVSGEPSSTPSAVNQELLGRNRGDWKM